MVKIAKIGKMIILTRSHPASYRIRVTMPQHSSDAERTQRIDTAARREPHPPGSAPATSLIPLKLHA